MEEIKEACGIKIGEYIRASGYYSFIAKIKKIEFDNEARLFWFVYDKKDFDTNITKEWRINKPYITKHSSNIRDLVEENDAIKFWYEKERICNVYKTSNGNLCVWNGFEDVPIKHIHIKSICTKEEFAAVEYKLDN